VRIPIHGRRRTVRDDEETIMRRSRTLIIVAVVAICLLGLVGAALPAQAATP
jgi:hypothetical protein